MARVVVVAQPAPGAYPVVTAGSLDVTMQAADVALGNYIPIVANKTLILVQNTHATDAKTFTITSVVDAYNRTGDITAYSLAAGDIALLGPFKTEGWSHGSGADGGVWINGESADVKIANITQG